MRITRKVMYEQLGSTSLDFNVKHIAANISHSDALLDILDFRGQRVDLAYPNHDWCSLDEQQNSRYDLVVADQVLEHVKYPQAAFSETHRILKDGGLAIITSCFLNPLHPSPKDYWRFTEAGLEHLASEANLSVLQVGSWGNRVMTPIGMFRTKWRGAWNDRLFRLLRRFDNKNLAISNWIIVKK